MRKPRKKQRNRLTEREKKFIRARLEGLNLTQAALAAGYSTAQPRTAGARAQAQIEGKAADILEAEGITDKFFVRKCILPALFATETKVFNNEGRLTYSKPLIAWGPRTSTNALVAKMKGLIKEEQPQQPIDSIKIVTINASYRPPVSLPGTNGEDPKAEGNGNGDGISH
jgi:hypothetical protein